MRKLDVDDFITCLGDSMIAVKDGGAEKMVGKSIYNLMYDLFKSVADFAEKKSKEFPYNWHDIRKNPEDLPEDGLYEVVVRNHATESDFIAYASFRNKIMYGKKIGWGFSPFYNVHFGQHDVIKWREIEPFEE